ncbi:zinc finger protein ZAT5 [Ziziphus jujuba]|uniref:Zinc finger protein ZAT5 n=2 Tax=Ziziphus jujuba TaxID=326968 RepID=A0ABM3I6C7_ZIZJJ|nr:zinc finger protein ZAT5 [Ziziphus jujuba]KAH7512025.1 hypothetical protein FEM48_Zijuj12G0046800 [Ziziphus jujuba var. spinosa]
MNIMDAQDEVKDNSHMIKGKRTKRQRPLSPLALTMASCSSGDNGGESGRVVSENSGGIVDGGVITASPTTSNDFAAESTEEEEDMANCLILLARGYTTTTGRKIRGQPVTSSSTMTMSGGTKGGGGGGGGGGMYVYQCKTCNRCFPSFQALGGHRASHKKPKAASNNNNNNVLDDKKGLVFMEAAEHVDHFNHASTALSLQISNRGVSGHSQSKANKLHECSICGAEFTSGQALGGHMRRHRTFMNTSTATTTTTTTTTTLSVGTSTSPESQESKKARNVNLQLDLNLPAPEDDRRENKFPFTAKEQVIVFSASPLVDCHY